MNKKFWEASLTGDLVCMYCGSVTIVHARQKFLAGPMKCPSCEKTPELLQEVIELSDRRAQAAYPEGRPEEDRRQWKGEDLYDG